MSTQNFTGGPFAYPGSYYCTIHTLAGNSYSNCTLNDTNGSVTLGAYASPDDVVIEVKYNYSPIVNNAQTYTYKKFQLAATLLTMSINNAGPRYGPGTTDVEAQVGEKMSLTSSLSPASAATGATYAWTVGGDKIGKFLETPWTREVQANSTATPPISYVAEVTPKGEVVAFADADLQKSKFDFYFTKGTFTGTTVPVSLSVKIGGKTLTRSGTIKVFSPELTSFISSWTNLNPPWGIRPYNNANWLMLGRADRTAANFVGNGFKWTISANIPVRGAGELGFCQLT